MSYKRKDGKGIMTMVSFRNSGVDRRPDLHGTSAYNKRVHDGEIMLKSLLGFTRYIHVNCNGVVAEGRYPEEE
jgi:hypothetical protein